MKVYYIWRDKKEIKMKRSRKRKKNKTLSRSKKGLIILIIYNNGFALCGDNFKKTGAVERIYGK